MKITLTPQTRKTFTAGELCTLLLRYLPSGTSNAEITAVCTFGGHIKRVTIDVDHVAETTDP